MQLQAGDVPLYRATGFYGRAIWLKTWHRISHVECYIGGGKSVASRDGIGTGTYDVRLNDIYVVCRPCVPFDLKKALAKTAERGHRPYGWYDLLDFFGFDVKNNGIVCSAYVTEFLRDGDLDPFNGEPQNDVAPFEFEISNSFMKLYDNAYVI